MPQHYVSPDAEAKSLTDKRQTEEEQTPAEIQEEVRKYLRLIPHAAEPNLARVREIQDEIRRGTYLTREMIQETAGRLALRFLRKE